MRIHLRILLVASAISAVFAGCSDDSAESNSSDVSLDAGLVDANRRSDAGSDASACVEPKLFGAPNAATGLSSDECGPTCACSGIEAASFDAGDLERLRAAVFVGERAPIESDPYALDTPLVADPDEVCGVFVQPDGYVLQTFESDDERASAGAFLTHHGPCGACSTLDNLAAYASTTDLTQPVRQCGLDNLNDFEGNVACLQELGFDLPCAQVWAYNTAHTRENCIAECLAGLNDPYNLPDGGLNPCLACDEELSGPVFKAYAGRTRRNSGLASALCRPCDQALPVAHDYIEDL
jgi:hypothetical protein